MSAVHHVGNYLHILHDKASRDTMTMPSATMRRCEFGKHSAPNRGGAMIGRFWSCAKCKGKFK